MSGRDTPATRAATAAGIPFALHEYVHDPAATAYGSEAIEALGLDPRRVFKTLVVTVHEKLGVYIIPAESTLDLRSLGKGASLASPPQAERVTGYVVGGISPLGQRRALPTFLDATALALASIFVSGGRRGLEIELAPADLVALTGAEVRDLRRG